MSKQNPIRPHAARKIRDFSDTLLGACPSNTKIEPLAQDIVLLANDVQYI
jgi:hypothetical protein